MPVVLESGKAKIAVPPGQFWAEDFVVVHKRLPDVYQVLLTSLVVVEPGFFDPQNGPMLLFSPFRDPTPRPNANGFTILVCEIDRRPVPPKGAVIEVDWAVIVP